MKRKVVKSQNIWFVYNVFTLRLNRRFVKRKTLLCGKHWNALFAISSYIVQYCLACAYLSNYVFIIKNIYSWLIVNRCNWDRFSLILNRFMCIWLLSCAKQNVLLQTLYHAIRFVYILHFKTLFSIVKIITGPGLEINKW